MKSIGSFMALAGVASIVLSFLDRNLSILMWIDNWGVTAGWVIRIGLIVGGLALWGLSRSQSEAEEVA